MGGGIPRRALALLEALANLKGNPSFLPDTFQLIRVTAENVRTEVLDLNTLRPDWRYYLKKTQAIGNSWLAGKASALLAVPSAPSRESTNYLFNPLQEGATGFRVDYARLVTYDKRLFHIT